MADLLGTVGTAWTGWDALASEDGAWVQDTVTYGDNDSLLRQSLNLAQPNASDWAQTYGYDASWRLQSVTSPAGSFTYSHQGPSALVNRLTLPNTSYLANLFDGAGRLLSTTLLTSTQTVLNAHTYQYNTAHQRTRQTLTEKNYWYYGYDALGQLTSAKGKESGGTTRHHEQLTYGYDKAGNLTKRTNNALIQTFTLTNSLNQLNTVSRSGTFTVAGLVQGSPTNVTVKDNANPAQAATRYDDNSFARTGVSLVSGTNTFTAVARDASNRLATNIAISYLPSSISCTYDANGNLASDGRRTFEYDDADQLKAVHVADAWRTEFQYDAFGRRRVKREFVWVAGIWNLASETRHVYDHMIVVQERDGNNVPLVTYTRGQDLSGSLQAAGGIGGLLARTDHRLLTIGDPSAHAYYHADAGGNITALVDNRQCLVARYRYDPFGNLLGLAGPLAEANLYRFSSKDIHAASGLYHYGFRFYDPSLQRWLNRDPIEELGGFNLYAFVGNRPTRQTDSFGLWWWDSWFDYEGPTYMDPYGLVHNEPPSSGNRYSNLELLRAELGGYDASGLQVVASGVEFAASVNPVSGFYNAAYTACEGADAITHKPVGAGRRVQAGSEAAAYLAGGMIRCLGRGSTANLSAGTTLPRNLREQLAVQQAMANPRAGVRLRIAMTDPLWPASQGWVKMQQLLRPGGDSINVHYLFNTITGEIDDFKIVIPGKR